MKEQQLKQISNQNNIGLKQIQPSQNNKQQVKPTKQEKYETIKNLPSWSIEPPLEIKRGNQ